MALNLVPLVLDLYDSLGNPVNTGTVVLAPSAQLSDSGDHALVTLAPVTTRLFANPLPSVRLLATDNAGISPSGWTWTVALRFPGAPPPRSFLLPYSGGAVRYLSAV